MRLMISREAFGLMMHRSGKGLPAGGADRRGLSPFDKQVRDDVGEVRVERVLGLMGDVAVIHLDGPILFEPGLMETYFDALQPTDRVVKAINDAAGDDSIKSVVLRINSPGGSVAGWSDISEAIDRAKAKKKVAALVHDNAYSMGYRIAARCNQIAATPSAAVGSIGVIIAMYDDSAWFAENGVIAKPVASDDTKAQGYPGVPLTDAYLKHLQDDIVGPDYEEFVGEVASARGLTAEAVKSLGALCYRASTAKEIGLIDMVVSAGDFIAALVMELPQSPRPAATDGAGKGVSAMAQLSLDEFKAKHPELAAKIEQEAREAAAAEMAQHAATPATIAELKAEFGADAGFIVEQASAGATLATARKAWNVKQAQELEKVKAEAEAQAKRAAELAALPGAGNPPVAGAAGSGGGGGGAGGGGGDFEAIVRAKMAEGMTSLAAHQWAATNCREAHRAFAKKVHEGIGAVEPAKK